MLDILSLSLPVLVLSMVIFLIGAVISLLAFFFSAWSQYHPRYALVYGVGLTAQMSYVAWTFISIISYRQNGVVTMPGPDMAWVLIPLVGAGVLLGVYLRHWHFWVTALLWVFHLPLIRETVGIYPWLASQVLLCAEVAIWLIVVMSDSHMSLGPLALKVAFDDAPVGLAFFRRSGRYLALNRTMSEYLRELDLSPNLAITPLLEHLELRCSSVGGEKEARYFEVELPSGTVVLFICEVLPGPGGVVWQLQAVDVSERYELVRQLERQNEELEESFSQLKDLLGDIENSPERVRAVSRTRVHDILAQRLSAVHRFVEDRISSPDRIISLIRLLDSLSQDLIGGAGQLTPREGIEVLRESFAAVGLRIIGEISLPDSLVTGAAIVNLIRECATNALAHAGARELRVETEIVSGRWVAHIENANANPQQIREGHGLRFMARIVTDLGGEFTYEMGDPFVIRVQLPILSGQITNLGVSSADKQQL